MSLRHGKHAPRPSNTVRFATLGVLVGVVMMMAGGAFAHPADGFFELDGNITRQAASSPPDDWATLYNNGGNNGGSPLKFSGISEDVVNGTQLASKGIGTNVCAGILPSGSTLTTCDDTATGGSTKDDIDFGSWNWIWQAANDKNDIEHTFAAMYKRPSDSHKFLVFGLDKLSNSGNASIGFWFTQNQIALTPPGANNSPNGKFTGVHKSGDLLVQTDLTSGGSISRVEVFTWCTSAAAPGCAAYPGPASHPNLVSQGSQATDCSTAPLTAGFCGIATQAATTNTNTVWPFLYKFSGGVAPATTYPASTFFEGTVDLTKFFGDTIPCFSTGLGETRQSSSETSVLVDFSLFKFDVCSADIAISPSGVNEVGGTHTITAHVTKNNLGVITNAPNGTVVTFTKTGVGSFVGGVSTCTITNSLGTCSVSITSSATGTTTVSASTSVDFGGGVTKTASTGTTLATGAVIKRWVDANVSISPDAVNEVNHQHIFTITANGIPAGTNVTFDSITPTVSPTPNTTNTNTCATPTLSNGGTTAKCTVTINSSAAGTFTANAQVKVTFTDTDAGANPASVQLTRDTDPATVTIGSGPGGSGPATKRYVDARISITPAKDTDPVGDKHTLTGTVTQNDGLAAGAPGGDAVTGFGPAPNGTVVSFSLSNNTSGATFVDDGVDSDNNGTNGDDCVTSGGTGTCTIQITSSTAGSVDIHATTTFSVGGVSLTRETDGTNGNSGNATKVFVDARISITPAKDTDPVGDKHTLTGTVTQNDGLAAGAPGGDAVTGFGPAPNGTVVSFSLSNNTSGATFVDDGVDSDNNGTTGDDCVTSGGTGTCTIQITSSTAGSVDIHATTTFSVGGVSLTRETDGTNGNSGNATKVFVDARISITPAKDTDPVGDKHTLTGTVTQNDGLAAGAPGGDAVTGFGPAPNGTVVSFSLSNNTSGATFVDDGVDSDNNGTTGDDCVTSGGTGTCTIQITSSTAGSVDIHATTTFSVGGVSLTRETDGTNGNSGNATKVFVDARISITPAKDTDPVGDKHTLTGTVTQNDGLAAGAPGGDAVTGFGPAPNGTVVSFSLSNNTSGATFVDDGVDSDNNGTNGDDCVTSGGTGTCTIQITSSTAGSVDIHATTTFSVGGVSLTRETDGTNGNSGNATKVFVDARISITPAKDTDPVGDKHTLTGTVTQNDGLAAGAPGGDAVTGFGPAPNGTVVSFSLSNNTSGATFVDDGVDSDNNGTTGDDCVTSGGTGTCTIQITSSTAGSVDIHATTTFSVGGVSLTRETDGTNGNSGNATKVFVDARISITPAKDTDPVGDKHTLTGTVTQNDGLAAGAPGGDAVTGFGPAPNGTVVSFSLSNNTSGATFVDDGVDSDNNGTTGDDCVTSGGTGTCTIQITSSTAGSVDIHATTTFSVGGVSLTRETDGTNGNSGNATKVFVDARISITPDGKNFIYADHKFTVLVEQNDGLGANEGGDGVTGFGPVSGANPVVTLKNTLGATATITNDDCTLNGTGAQGQCTVTISSPTTGTTTAHATVDVTVGGVKLTRETDGKSGNSGDATKVWVSAQVTLNKTFDAGPFTSPGKACFTLSRSASPPPPVSIDSLEQCGTGASLSFTWHDLVPGDYTIAETTTPAGYTKMADITFTVTNDVNDAANLSRTFNATDPLQPGSFKIKKTISGSNDLGTNSFTFKVQPCGAGSTATNCVSPGNQVNNSPFTITNATNPITVSGLSEGYYLVTEINIPAGFTPDVNPQIVKVTAGDTGGVVTVTFNNKPTEFTALAPTQTTCDQFATGNALPQEDETYGIRKGLITNVSPGVFFFYASYSVTGTPQTLSVDAAERFNATNGGLTDDWVVTNGQAFLYSFANGACTKLTAGVTTQINGGQVVITLDPSGTTPVPNGTYVLGIKYTANASLIGSAPCHGGSSPCKYYFIPSRDGVELTSRAQALIFRKR